MNFFRVPEKGVDQTAPEQARPSPPMRKKLSPPGRIKHLAGDAVKFLRHHDGITRHETEFLKVVEEHALLGVGGNLAVGLEDIGIILIGILDRSAGPAKVILDREI